MTTQTGAMPATHFRRGWIYLLTLSLVSINYMDRSALGVVAQAVRGEFKLSPIEMGYLFSSFFWSYALCLLPIGIMLDRYSTRIINSVGIAVWSLAMAATAAASFYAHVYFDKAYHVEGSLLERFAWFRRMQQLHFVHHLHANSNFAVIDFFWDRVLGTYRSPDVDAR